MLFRRRVVITGLGAITPVGLGAMAFYQALLAGRSGVHPFRLYDPVALPVRFGGEIEEFDARNYLEKKDRKSLKMMVRTIQLAVAASRLAVDEGGVTAGSVDPERFGVVLGCGVIPGDLRDLAASAAACLRSDERVDMALWGREGLANIPPMWMLNHVPNMPACHVSLLHNAQGPNNTITQFSAAALFAIGEAWRIIQRDDADLMLTGGTDTVTGAISVVRGLLFTRLSHRNEDPEGACRPFAADRDGLVLGEGAGVLLLEDREHASKRGRTPLGEVVGFGCAFDRQRSGEGLARAIRVALDEAGIEPRDLDHVNAAGGGGIEDDALEARGIHEGLTGELVPVLAVKSSIGTLNNGAAGVELAASVLALREGTLPATRNHAATGRDCPIQVCREPRRVTKPFALKTAVTDQGQCAALVIRRGE